MTHALAIDLQFSWRRFGSLVYLRQPNTGVPPILDFDGTNEELKPLLDLFEAFARDVQQYSEASTIRERFDEMVAAEEAADRMLGRIPHQTRVTTRCELCRL